MGSGQTRTKIRERRFLNPSTGEYMELLEEEQERSGSRPRAKEVFILTYPATIDRMHQYRLSGRERDVLDQLCVAMAYSEPFRRPAVTRIAAKLGVSRATVHNAINKLRDLGILYDLDDDLCLIDPRLFWRGSEEKRREWIVMLDARFPDRPVYTGEAMIVVNDAEGMYAPELEA